MPVTSQGEFLGVGQVSVELDVWLSQLLHVEELRQVEGYLWPLPGLLLGFQKFLLGAVQTIRVSSRARQLPWRKGHANVTRPASARRDGLA